MFRTPYEELLEKILLSGDHRQDRTGTGTLSLFGQQMRFDLKKSFPLITTKKVHFPSILGELLWFLRGESNVKTLHELGVTIWDEWAGQDGELGPIYGVQWRSWPSSDGEGIDQIRQVIDSLKSDPTSRRHIVSAWNPAQIEQMALPPCHMIFQFYSRGRHLDCHIYQRSADMFLGVPFNIASYALLTYMIADLTGHRPGELVWTGGDCHIYANHISQVTKQLKRVPYPFPRLELDSSGVDDPADYTAERVQLVGYLHHPRITADVAV